MTVSANQCSCLANNTEIVIVACCLEKFHLPCDLQLVCIDNNLMIKKEMKFCSFKTIISNAMTYLLTVKVCDSERAHNCGIIPDCEKCATLLNEEHEAINQFSEDYATSDDGHHIINGDLNDEKIRLSTYVNYPHNATDFPTLLAENGLYYLNNVGENESKVKCNFCSFVIPIDQKRDRIINIHNQTSLECPLVANSICLNKPMIAKHESKEIFLKELIRNQSLESFKTCQLLIFPPVNSGNATLETTSKRRATFLSWPKEKHLNAQELSEAGFLYTGLSDCVRCLWCNVGLHEWEAGDSPWVEHARFSPECQYIYGIVVNKIPAARFVARCAESGACHYHEAGRRCTGKSCAGIKDEPKYSRFITYTSRLATLVPGSRYKDMKHMIADAGYFYDNKSLCCFDCGDKKFTINPNDVLMIEHAKTSPQCGYIRRQIGDEFIHIIQELLKSYDITFEMLKEHLPRYEQWFTEDSVKRRRKSEQNDDSVVMVLDEIRGSSQKKQACAFCEKENSAVRGLSCCKTVCCADCPYTRKLCLCGMPIDQSTQGPV